MADEKGLRVAKLCGLLNVSASAYYAWDGRLESKWARHRKALACRVREVFHTNHQIPGARKIARILGISRRLVADIMRENDLVPRVVKKFKATTDSNHNLPIAPNLLNREFGTTKPNQKWVSDITYIPTDEGWLYLAAIMDLHGREIVGWAMGKRMARELVISALKQASGRRKNPKGVLIHSDRGSQYCSHDYQKELKKGGFLCSMSRKGNCWDNAPMESFWGKLKQEWLHHKRFRTREDAMSAVFWYIEGYYRNYRLHQANGYRTPADYILAA